MLHGNVKGEHDWDSVFLQCDEQDTDICLFSVKSGNTHNGLYTTGHETYVLSIEDRGSCMKEEGSLCLGSFIEMTVNSIMDW